jgi:hypothetical protein
MSDPKPIPPQGERAAGARTPNAILWLAVLIAGWFWIARQPAQVSADVLQVVMLGAMGWSLASLTNELRGKTAMEMLALVGHWIVALIVSLVLVVLVAGALYVIWRYAGPDDFRLDVTWRLAPDFAALHPGDACFVLAKVRRCDRLRIMTKALKDALMRAEGWPEWAQDNLADIVREIDREVQAGTYRATEEELRKIDEALAAVRRGEVATDAEVEAVFAKHRGA